jgi:hypothetical protein
MPIFNNNLNVLLEYRYELQYDISNIIISCIDQGIAYIELDITRDEFIPVITLQTSLIQQVKDKSVAVGFNSEDMIRILQVAQEEVENEIANDDEIYSKGVEGLKEFLVSIGEKFGLEEVRFIEEGETNE